MRPTVMTSTPGTTCGVHARVEVSAISGPVRHCCGPFGHSTEGAALVSAAGFTATQGTPAAMKPRALVALTAVAAVVFLLMTFVVEGRPWSDAVPLSDVPLYEVYGELALHDAVPYRDF